MQSIIKQEFNEHIKVSTETIKSINKPIEIASNLVLIALTKATKFYYLETVEVQQMLSTLQLK